VSLLRKKQATCSAHLDAQNRVDAPVHLAPSFMAGIRTLHTSGSTPRFQVGLSEQCEPAHTRTHLRGVLYPPKGLVLGL
jgi:hypothetical protein